MAENPGSKDKSLEILDFIINVLKEHEINLDKTIDDLSTIVEQVGETTVGLRSKVEESEEKINNLQKDVTNLIGCLSSAPKKALPAEESQQEPQIQPAPAVSLAPIPGEPTLILRCNQWSDFQDLAMRAKRLSFNYKEDEKIFQVNAFMGDQMIMYSGALPSLSMILKKWLSRQLDINEPDILEGFLDKPK
ncbi:MAG: DUF948 domain-containing protein [Candidatus Bathyarchaeia archaeon]|jgi:hypothetical protein